MRCSGNICLAALLLAAALSAPAEAGTSKRMVRKLRRINGQQVSGDQQQVSHFPQYQAQARVFSQAPGSDSQMIWVQVPARNYYQYRYQYPGQGQPGPAPELPGNGSPDPQPPTIPSKPSVPSGGYPPAGVPGEPQPLPNPYPGNPFLPPTESPLPQPPQGYPQPQPEPQPQPQPEPTIPPLPVQPIDPVKEELKKNCQAPRGQFPSPNGCNKFINCWDDDAAEMVCPGDLLFNPKGFCDYPENVQCGDRPVTNPPSQPGSGYPNPPTATEPPKTDCASPFDRYRSPTKCGTFYVCVNSVPVEFQCPPGLDYSSELGVCDYPRNVDCGSAESSANTPPPPTTGGEDGSDGSDGSYPGDGGDSGNNGGDGGDSGSYPGDGGDSGNNGGDGGDSGYPGSSPPTIPSTNPTNPPANYYPPPPPPPPPTVQPSPPRPPVGYPQRFYYPIHTEPTLLKATGASCQGRSIHKVDNKCLSVFKCEGGRMYSVECALGFAFDTASGKCLPAPQARC